MELGPGQTAFVTGAASGIGLAIVHALIARGVGVVMADVDAEALATHATPLAKKHPVLALPLDVRDEHAWLDAAERASAWRGGVDVLCNVAGVVFLGALAEQPTALWRLTQAVNLDGPYYGVRAFLPRMLSGGKPGRVVNVASLAALWGENKMAAYSAAKAGLVGLSDALRLELARTPIGVTVVLPGTTRTGLGHSTQRLAASEGLGVAPAASGGARGRGMQPEAIGAQVVSAILDGAPYVVTHPEWRPMLDIRTNALVAAFNSGADPSYQEPAELITKLAGRLAAALAKG